jgi:signal transduction histidine kinase
MELFLLAVVLTASISYELVNDNDESADHRIELFGRNLHIRKLFLLAAEVIITGCLSFYYRDNINGLFLLPLVFLDTLAFFHLSFIYSIFLLAGIFINYETFFIYILYSIFIIIIYLQNYILIEKYRKYIGDYEKEEYKLKDSLHSKDSLHKEELQRSILSFENKMLEEKARLSQALHDKLGHSINGSIYQLEASKVLMGKKPEESIKIVQGVIDNLRTSMDEIRLILRSEQPDKKRMALIQLIGLCEECKEKYGIQAEVKIDGEDKDIPENIWEIILDNTFEAVTNALKYAKCTRIMIEIAILHKFVRCSITDNGVGCKTIKEGMGIQGMMDRTRKVNGLIDINSDNGFRINMILPIISAVAD